MELAIKEVKQLVFDLAESAMRERGLLMRPTPYFDRLDRFRAREAELAQVYKQYLIHFNKITAYRMLRSCTFADELSRDVLHNCYPSLPEEGENAQRTLWGAAVAIDQLLDEGEIEAAYLAPVLVRVAEQSRESTYPNYGRPYDPDPRVNALVSMLADALADCQHRALDACAYAVFAAGLSRMLDAELSSLGATLDKPPVERVRTIIHDKSILLTWVGFQACTLGQRFDPTEAREYQGICNAMGEILWVLDDLIDLEEDLERGIWNRALWRLYDEVGRSRFREMSRSKAQLAEGIASQGIVAGEIDEIAKRVNFLESHPRIDHPQKIRAMLSFWFSAWLRIYR